MALRRGDIVWADFEKSGASLKKLRPALVVQNDAANRHALQTLIVAIRADSRKGLPVHVPIPRGVAGLTKDSVADCGFIATIRQDLGGKVLGRLPPQWMQRVDEALRVSLGLA